MAKVNLPPKSLLNVFLNLSTFLQRYYDRSPPALVSQKGAAEQLVMLSPHLRLSACAPVLWGVGCPVAGLVVGSSWDAQSSLPLFSMLLLGPG